MSTRPTALGKGSATLWALTFLLQTLVAMGQAESCDPIIGDDRKAQRLSRAIQEGRLVAVMRHTHDGSNQAIGDNGCDCCAQPDRRLTPDGKDQAQRLRDWLNVLWGNNSAEIRFSMACRTAQTAKLIFPKAFKCEDERKELLTSECKLDDEIKDASSHQNLFLVTHSNCFKEVSKLKHAFGRLDLKRNEYNGVIAFLERKGRKREKLKYIGCIRCADWGKATSKFLKHFDHVGATRPNPCVPVP